MISELIARRDIATGPKGQRKLIEVGQRFNPADYPSVEWQAMLQHGIVAVPDEPTPDTEDEI